MAISSKLKAFLDQAKVPYTTAKHPPVYTAQEIAAAQHVPGKQLAKCVLVKTAQGPALCVLSATHLIDCKRLKSVLGGGSLSIAKEADVKAAFPDVEVGAMSPFGNLYNVRVAADQGLGESPEIVFNGGTHTETVKMRYQDFIALVKPTVGAFGQAIAPPAKAKAGAKRAKKTATPKAAKATSTARTGRKPKAKAKARKRGTR